MSLLSLLTHTRHQLRWLLIALAVGALAGSASAFFLLALDQVTAWREARGWALAILPVAGLILGWVITRWGSPVERGNDHLIQEFHDPKAIVPLRMAPLVLFGTLLTHLGGGSAGREGTAVQMGGSLADQLSRPLGLSADERRVILICGISAGFASVFGTPLAGAIFGLEVLAIGSLRADALLPSAIAALAADAVTRAWGVGHTPYFVTEVPPLGLSTLLAALAAGLCFGLVARAFAWSQHGLSTWSKAYFPSQPLRLFIGGLLVAMAILALGTNKYNGLGIPGISAAFQGPVPSWDFLAKGALTVLTLGFGFKGGEVTPLFFMGATLGNALSAVLALPLSVLAGMGLVAVFAGAANTPLACAVMAMELFGAKMGAYALLACVASYAVSGASGIYRAQPIVHPKLSPRDPRPPRSSKKAK